MAKNPISGCIELEGLLDSHKVKDSDKRKTYEVMLILVPSFRRVVEGESEWSAMKDWERRGVAKTHGPSKGFIDGRVYACGPIHVAATLGEIAEKYRLSETESEKLYTAIPEKIAREAFSEGVPNPETMVIDVAIDVAHARSKNRSGKVAREYEEKDPFYQLEKYFKRRIKATSSKRKKK